MMSTLPHLLSSRLGPLPASALAVAATASALQLSPGEPLLSAGQSWSQLFWVEQGVLRLYYLDRQGRDANKNFFLEGALFWPLTPALADEPVNFWIEAAGKACVWALPWRAWHSACAQLPSWQALERRTLAALLDDKMRREQQFLQCSAQQRYEALIAAQPDWMERISLRHLASYLGMTDVALSRIRRRLNPS